MVLLDEFSLEIFVKELKTVDGDSTFSKLIFKSIIGEVVKNYSVHLEGMDLAAYRIDYTKNFIMFTRKSPGKCTICTHEEREVHWHDNDNIPGIKLMMDASKKKVKVIKVYLICFRHFGYKQLLFSCPISEANVNDPRNTFVDKIEINYKKVRKIFKQNEIPFYEEKYKQEVDTVYFDKSLNKHKNIAEDNIFDTLNVADVFLLKAPMKFGKTKYLLNYIKNYKKLNGNFSIVILSFRRTFSREFQKKFEEIVGEKIEIYEDIPELRFSRDRIIIQVESLYKLIINQEYDFLIMDESESIISQFSSKLSYNIYDSISNFVTLFLKSKKIVIMDALLSLRTYNVVYKILNIYDIYRQKNELVANNYNKDITTFEIEEPFDKKINSNAFWFVLGYEICVDDGIDISGGNQLNNKLNNGPSTHMSNKLNNNDPIVYGIKVDVNTANYDITFKNSFQIKPKKQVPNLDITRRRKILVHKYKKIRDDTNYIVYISEAYFINKIFKSIKTGQKIVIISNSKRFCLMMKWYISIEYPLINIKLFTGDTSNKIKNDTFKNVDEFLTCDCLIYSPTITAGISYEKDHFNKMFCHVTKGSCDIETYIQMMGRIRSIKRFRLFCEFFAKGNVTTIDRKQLKKIDKANFKYNSNVTFDEKIYQELYYCVERENTLISNMTSNFLLFRLLYFIGGFNKICKISEKQTTDLNYIKPSDIRTAYSDNVTSEFDNMPCTLSQDEYMDLKRSKTELTSQERLQVSKYEFFITFQVFPCCHDFYKFYAQLKFAIGNFKFYISKQDSDVDNTRKYYANTEIPLTQKLLKLMSHENLFYVYTDILLKEIGFQDGINDRSEIPVAVIGENANKNIKQIDEISKNAVKYLSDIKQTQFIIKKNNGGKKKDAKEINKIVADLWDFFRHMMGIYYDETIFATRLVYKIIFLFKMNKAGDGAEIAGNTCKFCSSAVKILR